MMLKLGFVGVGIILEQLKRGHRPDIDGLRAIAVVPVLLFHAGLRGFTGGFVGVDVFFVISGFLITSILLREAEEARFSIVAFYYRRVRRIFPALFAMLLIVTALAGFLLAPTAFARYGKSLVAATLFSSNIQFWRETGYFDTSALEKPLLHTWSLAVEEQFYLIWPLILGTFFRLGLKERLLPMLCAGVAVSFVLAVVWGDASDVFYLPVTRAWELGLGAIIAVRPITLPASASFVAIAAVLLAIIAFDQSTPVFLASGFASAGTAVLICTEGSAVNRRLSLAPCVGIGLISYSLYLWHWPLLAFANYSYSDRPPLLLRFAILIFAGFAAYLSWRFVETPLRRPGRLAPAFAISGVVMALLVGVGLSIKLTGGFPLRFGPKVAAAESQFAVPPACAGCRVGKGKPTVVMWGDSYGMAYQSAVADFATKTGQSAVFFTRSACPPLWGAQRPDDSECERFHELVATSLSTIDPKLIILAARWEIASETTRFGLERGSRYFLTDGKTRRPSVADSRRALHDGLFRTVASLTAAHPRATIVLVGQAPPLGMDAERCMVAEFTRHQCSAVPAAALPRLAFSNRLLADVQVSFPNAKVIYLSRILCRSSTCPTHLDSVFMYRDVHHLSDNGAKLLLEPSLLALWSSRSFLRN